MPYTPTYIYMRNYLRKQARNSHAAFVTCGKNKKTKNFNAMMCCSSDLLVESTAA